MVLPGVVQCATCVAVHGCSVQGTGLQRTISRQALRALGTLRKAVESGRESWQSVHRADGTEPVLPLKLRTSGKALRASAVSSVTQGSLVLPRSLHRVLGRMTCVGEKLLSRMDRYCFAFCTPVPSNYSCPREKRQSRQCLAMRSRERARASPGALWEAEGGTKEPQGRCSSHMTSYPGDCAAEGGEGKADKAGS